MCRDVDDVTFIKGMYMVGAPSGGPFVTSVASIDNSWIFGNTMVVLDKETGISKTIGISF